MASPQFSMTLARFFGDLRVISFRGREAMNRLYRFDVRVSVPSADVTGFSLQALELPTVLTMSDGTDAKRTVHGITTAAEAIGRTQSGAGVFSLRIEPRMAWLKKRRTSRIFQNLNGREIVDAVLAQRGLLRRWRVARELPKRTYAVQYDETDFAFVSRILAEEGIFYSFDHPTEIGGDEAMTGMGQTEVISLSDTADGYAPIDGLPDLVYRAPNEGAGLVRDENHIQAFSLRHAMRSKGVLVRGFDHGKPPVIPKDGSSTDGTPKLDRANETRTFVKQGMTIYEPQHSREEALINPISARAYLESERADAQLAEGQSACQRVTPGRKFRLVEHELSDVDGEYVVVSCEHTGYAPEAVPAGQAVYQNSFSCAPSSVPQRPRRNRNKPRQTLETAIVVGPPGQDIHTDEYGRVKVQFHWDLDGEMNERSSCWLRVSQSWAGAGFGSQFIPRIGMEVLIGFIAGDPDRPIITGCVHNGTSPSPWSLPLDASRTGIITRSIPGPGPANELSFQDRTGEEEIAIRSAKTLSATAVADATVRSGTDLRIESGANRNQTVERDASDIIRGSSSAVVSGARSTEIGGDERLAIGGDADQRVSGNVVDRTLGSEMKVVQAGRYTVVGGPSGAAADDIYAVSGSFRVGSEHSLSLRSSEGIELRVGESRLVLQPNRIVIESPQIQLQAKESISALQGPEYSSSSLLLDGSASMAAGKVIISSGKDAASLVLDADAKLDGAFVKLNCGKAAASGAKALSDDIRRGRVRFRVLKDNLPPDVTSVTLVVSMPSGEVVERECPVGGEVAFEGRPNDRFLLLETRVKGHAALVEKVTDGEEPNNG